MPPKRNKQKSKSKRYSCDYCSAIDNTFMIQCNNCVAKVHLKCLGVKGLGKDDKWICDECLIKDLSRLPGSQADKSTSKSNRTDDTGHQNKNKRYSCGLCASVDNSFMVQCDDCLCRYHMKCLNIKSIHEDDEWVCLNCQEEKSPRHQQSANKSVQLPAKKKDNVTKPIEVELPKNVQENRSQGQSSHQSIRNSQTTRSSMRRRTEIELDRIEEERQLKKQRDEEYLDKKYKIMLENCKSGSERSRSEKSSIDQSSRTREWIQSQGVGGQRTSVPQNPMIQIQKIPTVQLSKEEFNQRIDDTNFDTTSPEDHQKQTLEEQSNQVISKEHTNNIMKTAKKLLQPRHQENRPDQLLENDRFMDIVSKGGAIWDHPLNEEFLKAFAHGWTDRNPNKTKPRERIPCPIHDARRLMFPEAEMSKLDVNVGAPCSNSTFAKPMSNKSTVGGQNSQTGGKGRQANNKSGQVDRQGYQIGGHGCQADSRSDYAGDRIRGQPSLRQETLENNTLVWDNYDLKHSQPISTSNFPRNDKLTSQSRQQSVKFTEEEKGYAWDVPRSQLESKFQQTQSLDKRNELENMNEDQWEEEDDPELPKKGSDPELSEEESDSQHQSNSKRPMLRPNRGRYDEKGSTYGDSFNDAGDEQIHSSHRSTKSQSSRRVEFEEPRSGNRSNALGVESQPSTNYMSRLYTSNEIRSAQIAARHVVDKKLPNFYGDPTEWLLWIHQYNHSTSLCGFSDGENLDRLSKCLKGKAHTAVKGHLFNPKAVRLIIDTLEMLYGRPEIIIKAAIEKIRERQPLKSENMDEIIEFAFEVQTACSTMEQLNRRDHMRDPMLVEELVDKLPTQEKKDWAKYKASKSYVTLKTLADWLFDLAKLLSTVSSPRVSKAKKDKNEREEKNEKAVGLEHMNVHFSRTNNKASSNQNGKQFNQEKRRSPCPVCSNECSRVENCSKFKSFDVDARWKAVSEYKLCRICLQKHNRWCQTATRCGINGCQYKHHTLLHKTEKRNQPAIESTANTNVAPSNFHNVVTASTMLRIVPVVLYNGNKSVETFAFYDEGTTVTMMEKRIAKELDLSGTSEQICLIWTKNIHRKERAERVSLEISGVNGFDKRYGIKQVRTVDELHLPAQSISKDELVAKYPYLKDVPLTNYKNAIPGIMIGSDIPKFGTQLEVIEPEDVENDDCNLPIASRTRLGWSVHGPRNSSINTGHVNVHQFEICPFHNELDNEIHQRVKEFFSIENFGVQANTKMNLDSKENERALEMLNQLTKKVDRKYETGLLWKSDHIYLPNSYPMALKRLVSLEKQGPEVIKILGDKVDDYVKKGYARKLSRKDLEYNGQVWYLPLFGVVHPKKPQKLRMVFDAAAKVKSVSLNSALLKGPDLYTSIIDILRRFRERKYTGGGDIGEMFHRVKIIEKDRHCQRFLFRKDCNQEPDTYQMDVMTFGASCSPCSAQFVKNKNAKDFVETHPRAVSAIIDNHYVDDMMECEHTEKEMIKLLKDVKMIHSEGGFDIRNFISNSENILKSLGENGIEAKNISMKTDLKIERVLGMWYNTKGDTFTFSLKYTPIDEEIFNGSKLPTKREILRILMSIFDPLGLLTNFLIYLKILLQEVWRSKMDWDESLKLQDLVERWKRWLAILPEVEKVKIPRLYSPKMSPNTANSIQMHVFVDASDDAFAALVYLRIEDEEGVDVILAGSKARVSPLKYLSIPRKELQGSILGVRLSASILNAQRFKIDRRVIWTDSATVISWINSDHRKYSQFVAHRVGEILEGSDVHEWRWIPTDENVADEATKWKKSPNFDPSNRWFSGPDFLRKNESQWPEKRPVKRNIEEEMKPNHRHSSLVIPAIIVPERFPNYKRMVRALAYALRFINLCTKRAKKGEPLTQGELRRAENLIFRQAQFEGYPAEMVTLERNKSLPVDKQEFINKSSPLYDGTPYFDSDGILRMKGRIDGARGLSMDTKRPIVLPKISQITKLLLLEYHSNFFHHNHEAVVNEVRQKFYIPNLRAVLKKIRKECQWCKIKQAHPTPPQMADLPPARMAARFVPYSYVGVDFFGPMDVAIGRRTEKRWGVLFTCLTIRAIHIEIASSLDTNSCIMCIQNFVADHGPVTEFHSDCGTNFKGSDNALQVEMRKIDPKKLQDEFTTPYTKWIFNPPASAHMGGSWERLIGVVKSSMDEVMPTRTPKEDLLRNLLKQIQNVVNSRPLTYIPLDVEEDEALTPNHFLKLSSNGIKPPCKIDLDGPYLRESWKEAQRLTEYFWKRFIVEYLPSIARRTKWHKPAKPLEPGNIVLIVDPNNPRNTYPKAKILRTVIGSNGQVRRAKVEVVSSTRTNSAGQICKVKKIELWRSAHKLALLDIAGPSGLADDGSETGGSVTAINFKSESTNTDRPESKPSDGDTNQME